jgi:hypothetical protein
MGALINFVGRSLIENGGGRLPMIFNSPHVIVMVARGNIPDWAFQVGWIRGLVDTDFGSIGTGNIQRLYVGNVMFKLQAYPFRPPFHLEIFLKSSVQALDCQFYEVINDVDPEAGEQEMQVTVNVPPIEVPQPVFYYEAPDITLNPTLTPPTINIPAQTDQVAIKRTAAIAKNSPVVVNFTGCPFSAFEIVNFAADITGTITNYSLTVDVYFQSQYVQRLTVNQATTSLPRFALSLQHSLRVTSSVDLDQLSLYVRQVNLVGVF